MACGALAGCASNTDSPLPQQEQLSPEVQKKQALETVLTQEGVERYAYYEPQDGQEYLMVGQETDSTENWFGYIDKISFYTYNEEVREYQPLEGLSIFAGTGMRGSDLPIVRSDVYRNDDGNLVIRTLPQGDMGYYTVYESSYNDGQLQINRKFRSDQYDVKKEKSQYPCLFDHEKYVVQWNPYVHTADKVSQESIDAEKAIGHQVATGTIRYLTEEELLALPEAQGLSKNTPTETNAQGKYLVIIFDEPISTPIYGSMDYNLNTAPQELKMTYLAEPYPDFTNFESMDNKNVVVSFDITPPVNVEGGSRTGINEFNPMGNGRDKPVKMPYLSLYKIL